MLDNIKLCGYEVPTPIQAYSIPAVLTGNDLIAVAQTGNYDTLLSAQYILANLNPRLRKDRCLFDSCPIQTHGKGQEACRASSLLGKWIQ